MNNAPGFQMSSTKANAFHRLCRMIGARMFLERMYTTHMSIPRKVRGMRRSMLKCASANINELSRTATSTRNYLVMDGSRNPLKIISSQMGATRDTTAT